MIVRHKVTIFYAKKTIKSVKSQYFFHIIRKTPSFSAKNSPI